MIRYGVLFTANIDGYSNYCGSVTAILNNSVVAFANPSNSFTIPVGGSWNTNETLVEAIPAITPFQLTGLIVQFFNVNPPGAGKSYTFSARAGNASPVNTPTVIIADSAFNGSSAIGETILVGAGESYSLQCVPSGNPDGNQAEWVFAQVILDPGTLTVGKLTDPLDPTTVFNFRSNTLSPGTWILQSEEERIFSNLDPSTLYDVEEFPLPNNQTPTYLVSNGDPIDAITVALGENVTVVVLNENSGGGLRKLSPGTTDDVGIKIPNPFFITAFLGDK